MAGRQINTPIQAEYMAEMAKQKEMIEYAHYLELKKKYEP